MINEEPEVQIDEVAVLEKFDGDGNDPKNLVERITIRNGEIESWEHFENGVLVENTDDKEVD